MREMEAAVVECAKCQTKNRLDAEKKGALCGKCGAPLASSREGGSVVVLNDANFQAEVMDSSLPVLVDCWAPWCGPCRMLAPVIDALASELKGRVKVGKLNTDEAPHTAQGLSIMSIPTLLIFHKGRLVDRQVGVRNAAQILQWLKQTGVM